MTYFELLKGILPVPQNVYNIGNEKKWNNFEKNTGIIFPKDYKELIGTYGTGGIGKFIWFLTPFEEDANVNFLKRMNVMLEAYRISKSHLPDYFIHNIYPEKEGLLPWGYTDNGDELYWKTNSSPEKWTIVIYESASPDYHEYKMQLLEFLYKTITGELICDVFPKEIFEEVEYITVDVK